MNKYQFFPHINNFIKLIIVSFDTKMELIAIGSRYQQMEISDNPNVSLVAI